MFKLEFIKPIDYNPDSWHPGFPAAYDQAHPQLQYQNQTYYQLDVDPVVILPCYFLVAIRPHFFMQPQRNSKGWFVYWFKDMEFSQSCHSMSTQFQFKDIIRSLACVLIPHFVIYLSAISIGKQIDGTSILYSY